MLQSTLLCFEAFSLYTTIWGSYEDLPDISGHKACPKSRKKEIISWRCCEPLCTKGFKTRENTVCENNVQNREKKQKFGEKGLNMAEFRHNFTMLKYGSKI